MNKNKQIFELTLIILSPHSAIQPQRGYLIF